MTIHVDNDLKPSSALREVSILGWAGSHFHLAATAFVGEGSVSFGALTAINTAQLKEPLIFAALKAGVVPDSYQAVLSPNAVTLAFSDRTNYLKMMAAIRRGDSLKNSDLRVQVVGRSETWHELAQSKNIWFSNQEQIKANGNLIRIEEQPKRKDYIFPNLQTMMSFSEFVHSGKLDEMVISHLRKETPTAPNPL